VIGPGKAEALHANSLFKAVFMGFTGILKAVPGPTDPIAKDRRLQWKFRIQSLPRFLEIGVFDADTIDTFCSFLVQFNRVYGMSGNITLNRPPNHRLLVYGLALKNPELKKKISATLKMMHDA
jgi:hypothetical protein